MMASAVIMLLITSSFQTTATSTISRRDIPSFDAKTIRHSAQEHAMNLKSVWEQGITGRKSTVCIVGDGIDMLYPGLRSSYEPYGSKNFVTAGPDPMPDAGAYGGTWSALEISGDGSGGCPVGLAYGSKVTGLKVISTKMHGKSHTHIAPDLELAQALNHEMDLNHIYACSWILPDPEYQPKTGLGVYVRRALANGAQRGRSGLGSIYVFNADNNAHGGFHDSIHAVSVGGINQHDSPVTENINAARMIVSYGFGAHATAGDSHDCNLRPSTPSSLIAGVYALALEVNPKLGARDIQWLTVVASTKLDDPNIRDWQTNKEMGKHFSHRAGYGKLDVPAFINAARRWKTVGILASQHTPWLHVGLEIPHGGNVVVSEHELIQIETTFYDVNVIEHVVLSLRFKAAAHQYEELLLQLESPSGMISHFTPYARNATNQASDETLDMTFMSVAHWGDNPIGKWRLEVSRRSGARITPSMELIQWRLTFHGQPADGRHEVYWPLHNDPFGPYLEDMDIALPTKDIGGTIHDAVEVMHSGDKNHHDSPYRRVAGVFAVVLVSFVAILGVVLQCLRYRENRRLEDTQSYFAIGEDEDGEDYTEDAKMLPGRSVDV